MKKLKFSPKRDGAPAERIPKHGDLHVFICDDHNDAIRPIHQSIRSGVLPFSDLKMVHFDAHPDLMVPNDMPASSCFDADSLYNALEESDGGIAEWILPIVYAGHLKELVWVRSPWAQQIADGTTSFAVGRTKTDNLVRVSSLAPYFVDDFLFAPAHELAKPKELHLSVTTAADACSRADHYYRSSGFAISMEEQDNRRAVPHMPSVAKTTTTQVASTTAAVARTSVVGGSPKPLILDICLDYFSTVNPFARTAMEELGGDRFSLLRDVFLSPKYRGVKTLLSHAEQLRDRLVFQNGIEALTKICSCTGTTDMKKVSVVISRLLPLYQDASKAGAMLQRFAVMMSGMDADARELIHWAGPLLDLPDHSSTKKEMLLLLDELDLALRSDAFARHPATTSSTFVCKPSTPVASSPQKPLPPLAAERPSLVTIACSTTDGYCPPETMEFLMPRLLDILKARYGTLSVEVDSTTPANIKRVTEKWGMLK